MADPTDTVGYLKDRVGPPDVVLVLGSGLGGLADDIEAATRIPYVGIPGFAGTTVAGHEGALVVGRLEGVSVAALQGRYHLYEGHDPATVALPVRALAALGAGKLVVTCAAGGLQPLVRPGELMLIDDHLNLQWRNPLVGPVQEGEERFPDMSAPYDPALQALAQRVALERGIPLQRGVYCAVPGPSYETRAEVRMLRRLGGHAVGMSTVPEVLAARAHGMRTLGIALITNLAAGPATDPLEHGDVIEAGARAAARFSGLVRGVLGALGDRSGR